MTIDFPELDRRYSRLSLNIHHAEYAYAAQVNTFSWFCVRVYMHHVRTLMKVQASSFEIRITSTFAGNSLISYIPLKLIIKFYIQSADRYLCNTKNKGNTIFFQNYQTAKSYLVSLNKTISHQQFPEYPVGLPPISFQNNRLHLKTMQLS